MKLVNKRKTIERKISNIAYEFVEDAIFDDSFPLMDNVLNNTSDHENMERIFELTEMIRFRVKMTC